MTLRNLLIDIADDYQNNYLSPDKFADHNHLNLDQAIELLGLARAVRASKNPNE